MTLAHLFILIAALGLALMSLGFAWRQQPWGIAILAAGIINTLAAVGFGIYLAL